MSTASERAREALGYVDEYGLIDPLMMATRDLIAEVEGLHSWDGLMSLLDEHWPEDIFPTLDDTDKRDPGPRIISLIRSVDLYRKSLDMAHHETADEILRANEAERQRDRWKAQATKAMRERDEANELLEEIAELADSYRLIDAEQILEILRPIKEGR